MEKNFQENAKKELVRNEAEVVAFFENLFPKDETLARIVNALGNLKSPKTKKNQAEGFYNSLVGMIAKEKKLLEIDGDQLESCIKSTVEKNLDLAFSGDGKKSKISGKNEQRNIRKIFSNAEKESEVPINPDNGPRNLGAAAINEDNADSEKGDDANGLTNSGGERPNVFEGKKSVLDFISDKVRQDWETEVLKKEALKRQIEAESEASDVAEKLRKFAGNSGNISAGAAGTSPQSGVFGAGKVEEEKTGESEENPKPQEQTEGEKGKGEPGEPSAKANEINGEETKSEKKEKKESKKERKERTFNESLEHSKEKQFSTLSKIESGELDVSYFSGLTHYLSEIKAYYEKEKLNIETLSEPNRKRAEAEYEKTSKEIESRWQQLRDTLVLRVKGYIDRQVERNLNRLERDKADGKINDDLKEYTLLKDLIAHAIPREPSSKEEIEKYLEKKRRDIHQAYREARKNKTGSESAESSEGEKKEEKEKFELPEKIMDVFKGVAKRVHEFYLKELGGDDGYLSGFSGEDGKQFLRLLVEKVVNEKIDEKESILIDKFGFSSDKKEDLVKNIIDSAL